MVTKRPVDFTPALPSPAWTRSGLIRQLKSSSIAGSVSSLLPISSAPGAPQTWNSQSRAPHLSPCCPGHPLSLCLPPTDPEGTGTQRLVCLRGLSLAAHGPHRPRPPRAALTHCWEVHTGRSIQCDSGSQQTNELSPQRGQMYCSVPQAPAP